MIALFPDLRLEAAEIFGRYLPIPFSLKLIENECSNRSGAGNLPPGMFMDILTAANFIEIYKFLRLQL